MCWPQDYQTKSRHCWCDIRGTMCPDSHMCPWRVACALCKLVLRLPKLFGHCLQDCSWKKTTSGFLVSMVTGKTWSEFWGLTSFQCAGVLAHPCLDCKNQAGAFAELQGDRSIGRVLGGRRMGPDRSPKNWLHESLLLTSAGIEFMLEISLSIWKQWVSEGRSWTRCIQSSVCKEIHWSARRKS